MNNKPMGKCGNKFASRRIECPKIGKEIVVIEKVIEPRETFCHGICGIYHSKRISLQFCSELENFFMLHTNNNILLLAGNGQNVGKTLFACQVIENLSSQLPIVGIKICPHFHDLHLESVIVKNSQDLLIAKETSISGNKDSNRLLQAGATQVYYVQATDSKLKEMMLFFNKILEQETPVIIESGGLRNILNPGLFLMIERQNNKTIKSNTLKFREISDLNIEFNGEQFNINPNKINFSEGKWTINK